MRRLILLLALVLLGMVPVLETTPQDARNVRLRLLQQLADSAQYELRWNAPPGQQGQRVTGYDWQVDYDDDATGFEGTHYDLQGSTDAGTRVATFWVPTLCDQGHTWVFTRVRAKGTFTDTQVGPWVTGPSDEFDPEPCVVTAPTELEIFLDRVSVTDPPDPEPTDLALLDLECGSEAASGGVNLWVTATVDGDPSLGSWYPVETLMDGTLAIETRDYSESGARYGETNETEEWHTWDGTQDVLTATRADSYPLRITSGFTRPSITAATAVMYQVDAGQEIAESDETNNAAIVSCVG